jgi:predicted O-methyltransferase YrrM
MYMDFLNPKIEQYAEVHTKPESAVLSKLNRETYAKIHMPRMLAGHLQGQLLSMISNMIRPKLILEIGTYTGYSAICLASGLQKGGVLHTIDINEELEGMILRYFKEAEVSRKIKFHVGNALEVIPAIKGKFDLVFIDADKENYCNYYDLVFPRVKKGGYIIADNVLWSGKVLYSRDKMDDETRTLDDYNKKITKDPRVENILLPVRDGLMIARKL